MILREAYALGTPVAVADIGPLKEFLADGAAGISFAPNDPKSAAVAIANLLDKSSELQQAAQNARGLFERLYTSETSHQLLMSAYSSAIRHHAETNGTTKSR